MEMRDQEYWIEIEVPVTVVTLENMLRGELDENTVREDFRPSEQFAIHQALEERERRAAKDRQREHGGTAPGKGKNTGENFPPVKGKSRDELEKVRKMSLVKKILKRRQE